MCWRAALVLGVLALVQRLVLPVPVCFIAACGKPELLEHFYLAIFRLRAGIHTGNVKF